MRVVRRPSSYANGNTVDREGRLITCGQRRRSITRTEPTGDVTTLVDHHGAARLNSPNDAVARSDGTIWFTDPAYGILPDDQGHRADPELEGCYVFRFDKASHRLEIAADDGISESTARQHLSGLYRRVACENAAQAAYRLGASAGWVA